MRKHWPHLHLSLLLVTAFIGVAGLILSITFRSVATATSSSVSGSNYFGIASGGGLQYLSSSELAKQLDGYKALGSRWVRFDINWSDIQSGGAGSYNWARYDAVVSAANARGLKVLGTIDYTPAWARPGSCSGSDKCGPANASDYGNFAGAAAAHFGPRGVHYWEIWNEPNISNFWKPSPNPTAYTQLLKVAYNAIKAADGAAIVVTAGLSPASTNGTNYSPPDFLNAIYGAGGKNYFDAVGAHPYCFVGTFDCPGTYASWSAWSQMNDTPTSMRSIMAAHGDSAKKIWGTEFGAPTNGDSQAVTESHQASMLTSAYNLWRSYSFTGPLFWYSYHDNGTNTGDREDWFGLVRHDYSHKPAYDSYKALAPAATGGGSSAVSTSASGSSATAKKSTTTAKPSATTPSPTIEPAAKNPTATTANTPTSSPKSTTAAKKAVGWRTVSKWYGLSVLTAAGGSGVVLLAWRWLRRHFA